LSGAVVIEGDFVGFKARDLVEGICNAITTSRIGVRTTFNMDALCKELQGILLEEARRSAVKKGINGTGNQKYDFLSVFSLFDEDHLGSINVDEFRKMLSKLQLIDTLPIDKIPELLRKFDPNNTGSFTLDDLTRFCLDKQYGNFDADDEHAFTDDDDADFSENELPESSSAPTAITQLAEADWLIWALWKNAVSRNSKDPEGVITKIESQCAEVQLASFKAGTVSDKDLWFILSELDMKKGVSKNQFDAGISHFCIDPKAKISGGIDYEWFCRSIIRMGRAFNFMVQQKKKDDLNTYNTLKVELQSELATLVENDIQKVNAVKALKKEDSGNDGSVVKVFRRLDMDGDGKLTVQEFKAALRRLQIKNAKKWTNRLVRRLFDEIDSNKDGRLDISEFLDFIRAKLKSDLGSDPWGVDGAKKKSKNSIDYDDDDRLFNAQRKISDNEIYRKVCATLQESVPNVSKDHVDDVRNAVRKFFQKSDPDDKGYVNEERFRAFCRRSGLQDSLTTSEIQSMMKKLQKPQSGSDAEGAKINYEKFIDEITKSVSGVPHSQGEALLVKLQDAYDEAAYSGRPFLGLCSLIDPKMSGHINRQEVLTAFKMMACPMTMDELKGLLEVLPNNVLEKDDLINYNELNLLLQKHTPRVGASRDTLFAATQPRTQVPPLSTAQLNRTGRPNRRTGALPAYSTPGTTTRPTAAMLRNSGTINTPFGVTISIPQPRQEHLQAHVDTIQEIWTDLQKAIEERTMGRKGRYSLIKQCSVFDPEGSGFIETSSFQSIIDDLGILLSPADLYAIESVYGHPNFDSIDYESFSTSMDEFIKNSGNRGTQRMTITASHMGIAKWITPRILENYRLLRMDGEDPADIFRGLDTDRSGLVKVHV
jgi:Ca2+-binding EF-hand superfamily protein